MTHSGLMKKSAFGAALFLASTHALAQTSPWTVELTPTLSPLPIGLCGAVQLKLLDPVTKDVPRTPQGYRITLADFDLSVSGGTSAAGNQIDASHYEVCGCQGASAGATATVTARYPAQSLSANARVPGVSIQQSATFTLAAPKGTLNPQSCVTLANNAGAAPIGATRGTPLRNPPAPPSTPNQNQPVGTAPATGRTPGTIVPAAPAPAAAALVPANPTGFTAGQGGPGEVLLSWDPVSNAEYYVLFGPGLEHGGQRVEQGAGKIYAQGSGLNKVMVPLFSVPSGMQEWAVGSYYPNNLTTPAAEFPRASLNVTGNEPPTATSAPPPPATSTPPPATLPVSGKYLVTLTGIRCYQASMDDMLSRDGMGDEVYAATYIRRYDRRTGELIDTVTRQSASHGDVQNFGNQRLQAGSRSQTGGIQDGDMIPGPALIATRSVVPQDVTFPMRLWEGTLTDGVDALVMSPSLWEQDVGDTFYGQWLQNQKTLNLSMFAKQGVQDQISQKAFGAVIFGMSGNDSNASGMSLGRMLVDTGMMALGAGVPIIGLLATTADRPLGLVQNGRDVTALPNHTVILTREIIEAALAKPALGNIPSPVANMPQALSTPAIARIGVIAPKPGIIVVHLQERDVNGMLALPERPAIYQMYIQVERVP
jgi:hypothetical protein